MERHLTTMPSDVETQHGGDKPHAKDETRRPTLVIVMLVIIVLTLATFLMLRPRGPGASQQTSPASSR